MNDEEAAVPTPVTADEDEDCYRLLRDDAGRVVRLHYRHPVGLSYVSAREDFDHDVAGLIEALAADGYEPAGPFELVGRADGCVIEAPVRPIDPRAHDEA